MQKAWPTLLLFSIGLFCHIHVLVTHDRTKHFFSQTHTCTQGEPSVAFLENHHNFVLIAKIGLSSPARCHVRSINPTKNKMVSTHACPLQLKTRQAARASGHCLCQHNLCGCVDNHTRCQKMKTQMPTPKNVVGKVIHLMECCSFCFFTNGFSVIQISTASACDWSAIKTMGQFWQQNNPFRGTPRLLPTDSKRLNQMEKD